MYFILIPIAIAAIIYKSYLHEKLEGEPYADIYAITGFIAFKHFFSLKKGNFGFEKYHTVRKANIALGVFWTAFILALIIVLVEAALESA